MLRNFIDQIKSSPRFGEMNVTKNLQEILKERRFLFFTKKGPIEVVFNIKHYISGFLLSIFVAFKILQFALFGVINVFTHLMLYKNSINQTSQFTKSEVEVLKNLAEQAIVNESIVDSTIKKEKVIADIEDKKDDFVNLEIIKNYAIEKYSNFKDIINEFDFGIHPNVSLSDESVFDEFVSLASPEMVPIEESSKRISEKQNSNLNEREIKKEILKRNYNSLPVLPFSAPRNNKTKITQFTRKIDLEIMELLNVFKTLKLSPDNINLKEIDSILKKELDNNNESELINSVTARFQFLENLKDAIVYLPLKPPMQYYYVSSPYGLRTHPKTKIRQMHKGIDMAGTWQEEVRASANGTVIFSGRNGSFGKTIKIKHKHGIETLYGHLHKILVKKGTQVKEGEIVGKMGATGRAVGAHLHYEIIVNKKHINPYNFISIGRNLLSSSILKD